MAKKTTKKTKKTEAESPVIELFTPGADNIAGGDSDVIAVPEKTNTGIDPDRPFIYGVDKRPIQMQAMEELILREEYDDEVEADLAVREELEIKAREVEVRVAKSQVDLGVPERVRKSPPKSGKTVARIEIHMRQVFGNIIGRRNVENKFNIPGLYTFGHRVNQLIMAYSKSSPCPYASWYLWKIEKEIQSLRKQLVERQERVDVLIEKANVGIEYEIFTSNAPTIEVLSFNSVHAYQVASVLHQYDQMLRTMWPYVRNHFISSKDFHGEGLEFGRGLRSLFQLPNTWYYVGADAVSQKTALYLAARERMGDVPEGFITGEITPEWV